MDTDGGDNKKVVYPELSYRLVGILFSVYNELGIGYREKRYEEALGRKLKQENIPFQRQLYIPVRAEGKVIAKDFADFIIEEKIILELKRGDYFSQSHIDQVNEYLKATQLQLGIIAQFTSKGVKFKRILNLY